MRDHTSAPSPTPGLFPLCVLPGMGEKQWRETEYFVIKGGTRISIIIIISYCRATPDGWQLQGYVKVSDKDNVQKEAEFNYRTPRTERKVRVKTQVESHYLLFFF